MNEKPLTKRTEKLLRRQIANSYRVDLCKHLRWSGNTSADPLEQLVHDVVWHAYQASFAPLPAEEQFTVEQRRLFAKIRTRMKAAFDLLGPQRKYGWREQKATPQKRRRSSKRRGA